MLKSNRGTSLLEALYPVPPDELVRTAKLWVEGSSDIMLRLVWQAYDKLFSDPSIKAALAVSTDDIERGLTRLFYLALDDLLSGNEPFRLLHEAPEDESRKRRPARPRAYDIAFVMRVNPRIMWSVETKVLQTPNALADYVSTVKQRFLSGDYAPYVAEGVMAGYLLAGAAEDAFKTIAKQLNVRLTKPKNGKVQLHRISTHRRTVPLGKVYPVVFSCHHLIMPLH